MSFDLDSEGLTEDEYGGGTEIPSTSYLIFGILTFWIFTVVKYYQELRAHLQIRRDFFKDVLADIQIPDREQEKISEIIDEGFQITPGLKNSCVAMFATAGFFGILLIIFSNFYSIPFINQKWVEILTYLALSIAPSFFCVATIMFLLWAQRTIKRHEYCELLIAKYIEDREPVKRLKPSFTFTKRWNNNQNMIVLFVILTIPLSFSPAVTGYNFFQTLEGLFDVDRVNRFVNLWYFVIKFCGATLHFCGVKLLMDMFNEHLRIETVNREILKKDAHWADGGTASILEQEIKEGKETSVKQLAPIRSLAAIMMTDIVGYSKSMAADEDKTIQMLGQHNLIIRKHIANHNGDEIKTIGDAFLVRFNSAVDAVKSAKAIQDEFREHNNDKQKSDRTLVRIGIHLGDILLMNNDIFGNGVNIAARIEPLAEPGGICISADVYNAVKKSIDVKMVSLGKMELKNIDDAPEIYKILVGS